MTETGGTGTDDAVSHSPSKAKSPNDSDNQQQSPTKMDVDVNDSEVKTDEVAKTTFSPPPPSTPRNKPVLDTSNIFKTPEPLTPNSANSAKKRKRLTPEEKNLREKERLDKRLKLEEEKQKKEQEKIERARQKEAEKQRKEEERRRQEEEKKLERQRKEEEKKKAEEEKQKERIKKEEEKKRLEEEKTRDRLKKEEEKRKKDEERRQKIEEKEREQKKLEEKKAKQAQFFTNFFQKSSAPKVQQVIDDGTVYLASNATTNVASPTESSGGASVTSDSAKNLFNPLPFQIKTDMAIAPLCRRDKLSLDERKLLDNFVSGHETQGVPEAEKSQQFSCDFVKSIKSRKGRKYKKTEVKQAKDLEVQVIDDDIEKPKSVSGYLKWRIKLLQFHENRRPAYWGTWKRKPKRVTARKPFVREEEVDYDFDSDDEWEDEPEDAEEIVDSDKEEKEKDDPESDDEDEEGWMVPHGYLSDGEREGAQADLESIKTKEKEFYKSLSKKSMMEYPFIETTNLTCFAIRICPVFKSANPVKPARKRAKPKPKVQTEATVEATKEKQVPATPAPIEKAQASATPTPFEKSQVQATPTSIEKPQASAKPSPIKNPFEVASPATAPTSNRPQRIRKVPTQNKNPYAKQPSGFLAMDLPSDEEDDMDWEHDSPRSSDSSSGEDDENESDTESLSSDDEDIFIPIIRSKPKTKD